MAFLAVSWGGAAAVLLREWIFLRVMVGGSRGVAGPKELMGLVGVVTDCRAYSPPTPRSVEVEARFFTTCQILWMMTFQNLERSVKHVMCLSKRNVRNNFLVLVPPIVMLAIDVPVRAAVAVAPVPPPPVKESKNLFYHTFHSKLHSDYLKSQCLDLNEKNICG
jgi:hypothetical protein